MAEFGTVSIILFSSGSVAIVVWLAYWSGAFKNLGRRRGIRKRR